MKKLLKILGVLLLLVTVVIAAGYFTIDIKGIPSYEVPHELEYRAEITPKRVERGARLASMLCANCHMNRQTRRFSGKVMKDAPAEFGMIYAQNITQDKEYGIGDWTDAELMYLLRTGIKRDGSFAPPYMAKLPLMSDEDLASIIAFLRSDHPMVQADPTPDKPCEPSFLTKMLCNTVMKPLPMPDSPIHTPDTTDMLALGEYLAHNLDCFSCHSADFKTNDFLDPAKSEGYFGGGNLPLNMEGQPVATANLTPDPETGIGNWTEAQFVRALRSGIKDGEPALRYPMVPYPQLTETEARAIFTYLKTIPPIVNDVPRTGIN